MIVLKAPAKVNLTLKIIGKRADGYHALESVFFKINDLCDELTFVPAGNDYDTLLESNSTEISYDDNIIINAANELREFCGVSDGVRIILDKKIPIRAGLGGGSSDAASTLMGLNKLWNLNLNNDILMALGAKIGSDVSFFICSENAAIVTGRGEYIEPFNVENPPNIVIEKRLEGLSTKLIYQELKAMHPDMPLVTDSKPEGFLSITLEMKQALIAGDHKRVGELLVNDLEAPAVTFLPQIKEEKQALQLKYNACGTLMSGSGSAIFSILG